MKRLVDNTTLLPSLTLLPERQGHDGVYPLIIALHGYGAEKNDLAGLAEVILPEKLIWLFPDGPLSAFDGADPTARAWHERGGTEQPETVRESLRLLGQCIDKILEKYENQVSQVLLLGFSQGGSMAMRYGIPRPQQFAGIIYLSGALRQPQELSSILPSERNQPLFLAHGRQDTLVPFQWSSDLHKFLEKEGYHPYFKLYSMGHHISPEVVRDLEKWIGALLHLKV